MAKHPFNSFVFKAPLKLFRLVALDIRVRHNGPQEMACLTHEDLGMTELIPATEKNADLYKLIRKNKVYIIKGNTKAHGPRSSLLKTVLRYPT